MNVFFIVSRRRMSVDDLVTALAFLSGRYVVILSQRVFFFFFSFSKVSYFTALMSEDRQKE